MNLTFLDEEDDEQDENNRLCAACGGLIPNGGGYYRARGHDYHFGCKGNIPAAPDDEPMLPRGGFF